MLAGGSLPKQELAMTQVPILLKAAAGLQGPWEYTWHTYPTSERRAVLYDRAGEYLCAIDLLGNAIGSDCGVPRKNWPPICLVTPEVAQSFRELLRVENVQAPPPQAIEH